MRYLKGPKRYTNIYCEILCLHDWGGGPDGKKGGRGVIHHPLRNLSSKTWTLDA